MGYNLKTLKIYEIEIRKSTCRSMQFPLCVSLWSNKNQPSPGTLFGDMEVATPAWWDGVDVVLGVNLVSSNKIWVKFGRVTFGQRDSGNHYQSGVKNQIGTNALWIKSYMYFFSNLP